MRKYIHVAKAISPVLTQEAANHIAEEYTRLRNQEQLGTDIARVRGSSNLVDTEDATPWNWMNFDILIIFFRRFILFCNDCVFFCVWY